MDPSTKAFYVSLLNHGGPKVHDLVALLLLGPALRSSKRERAKFYHYCLGIDAAAFANAVKLLKVYGLFKVPCVLSEDGSALQPRLEALLIDGRVMVYGLNEKAYECTSAAELDALIAAVGIARTVYIFTLVPLVENAPHIPIAVIVHDNSRATFTERSVWHWWHVLWAGCAQHQIHLVGHVSDGDARLRQAVARGFLKWHMGKHPAITVDHHLVQLAAPMAKALGCTVQYVLANIDWLHIIWRMRVQFLSGKRYLQIGHFGAHKGYFVRYVRGSGQDLGLLHSDLDVHDKQNYEGCLRMYDFKVRRVKTAIEVSEVTTLRDALATRPEFLGSKTCSWSFAIASRACGS